MDVTDIIPVGFRQPPVLEAISTLVAKIEQLENTIEKVRDALTKGDILCEVKAVGMLDEALPDHKRN